MSFTCGPWRLPLRIALVLLSLSTTLHSATSLGEYHPRGSVREYFMGAWKLVAAEVRYPGNRIAPFPDLGPDAVGFLLYTPSGHMCAQLMKPGRPRWFHDDTPTPGEAVTALNGFTSYCGTFEVHEADHTVIHRPETAWSPNWLQTDQVRLYYLVNQDRFFFQGVDKEKQKDGKDVSVVWTITWERLK